jgi:hypothetical protein
MTLRRRASLFRSKALCIEIEQVLDRWHQGDWDPEWPIADCFKEADHAGQTYLLRHDRESDVWAS